MHKFATDKLIVPGYLNLLEKDARAQMTAGKAGLIFNGPWDIPAWKKAAPDWKYSISAMPSPEGKPYNVPFLEGSNSLWVYADTKLASVVGQIVAYMGSPEGQKMMVILSEGNLQSLQPEANKAADQPGLLDVNAKRAVELAKESMRIAPRAELRNPDVAKVAIELQPVTPNFKEVMQGLLSGQLKNPRQQFAKFNASLEAALEKAIAAAKKKGSTVTRDDYKFDNWDRRRTTRTPTTRRSGRRDHRRRDPAGVLDLGAGHAAAAGQLHLVPDRGRSFRPRGTTVRISAYRRYRLWINGVLVDDGPPPSVPEVAYVDSHDVARLLRPGRNCLAVAVRSIGDEPDRSGLLVELDGPSGVITATGVDPWWCRPADAWSRDTAIAEMNRFEPHQEIFDAAREPDGWREAGFTGSGWCPAMIIADPSAGRPGGQWSALLP